ncbi:DUF6705 family protein [Winogradskyella luteola]|uniref:DUF6705 domain-containing protein n=1 Tax=Winogradskyella luteola TaxID=2828330 RepID=A0A9X1F7A0_9FLAO|nr:DUF6705 family protein [Winogradskyella luteola]MBV7267943.1 hypothetical protein [Winogradskyella luteola]
MKQLILILSIITTLSCKAQSPIVPIEEKSNNPYSENIYYKDVNGIYDPYIGTWVWQDGNSSITIEIVKLEQVYYEVHTRKLYKDRLIGRIKYIENGVEIFNTLSNSDDDFTLINKNYTPKDDKFNFRFEDPLLPSKTGHVDFDLINDGAQATFRLRNTEGVRFYQPGETPEDPDFSMPRRVEFTLTKQ